MGYNQHKTDEYLGYFTTSANVRNEVTSEALNQIIAEINRLRNEIVGEDELQMVKNVVAGNFSRSIENPLTIVKFAFAKKNSIFRLITLKIKLCIFSQLHLMILSA
jgi:predicted Zn-dependent peptidase